MVFKNDFSQEYPKFSYKHINIFTALTWLEYENSLLPQGSQISHGFNTGERSIGHFYVDGLVECPADDGSTYRIVYEYFGCRIVRIII